MSVHFYYQHLDPRIRRAMERPYIYCYITHRATFGGARWPYFVFQVGGFTCTVNLPRFCSRWAKPPGYTA